MITLHFHLIPQYKYELFHIYFTWFHCTGRNELNKLTLLSMCGFIAQLVEHRTGIAEVMGSNPVEALIFFFRLLLSNCLNWKIYCDDHSSLSSHTAVQIWIISYIFHSHLLLVVDWLVVKLHPYIKRFVSEKELCLNTSEPFEWKVELTVSTTRRLLCVSLV